MAARVIGRRPRRRGPHRARLWLDGVEMPSSGRPGASPAYILGLRPNHTSSRGGLLSRATLGWADEASAPTRISPLRGLRRATPLAPNKKPLVFTRGSLRRGDESESRQVAKLFRGLLLLAPAGG